MTTLMMGLVAGPFSDLEYTTFLPHPPGVEDSIDYPFTWLCPQCHLQRMDATVDCTDDWHFRQSRPQPHHLNG